MMGCQVNGSHHAEYVCTSIFFDTPGASGARARKMTAARQWKNDRLRVQHDVAATNLALDQSNAATK
jgi:hypothetical protein